MCMICKKNFSEKGNLRIHYKIHSGEKKYPCKFMLCKKKFITNGNLLRHIKIHLKKRRNLKKIQKKKKTLKLNWKEKI